MNPNGLDYTPTLPSFLAATCYQMTMRNTIVEDGVTRRDFLTLVPSAFFFCRNLGGKEQTGMVCSWPEVLIHQACPGTGSHVKVQIP